MSFRLTRPPSPRGDMPHHSDDDSLSAALHAALSSFTSHNDHHDHHQMAEPKGDKFNPTLDIVVNSETLCLRGTGVDVNPALLSGNVVLHLSEPTAIKEIVLQFRGKARLPVSASEPLSLSSSQLTYLVCNHEWSFLEGDRHHSHTLKAGRHLFPFQLQIGGSLPSSIATSALGGASVHYKLRATAVRPGFSLAHRDLHATCPINIVRGFSPEALEYQQTLEIENTWPEKLMYSIMIPHKAWAAGEKVTAVVKFSPLVKGARVLNVTTTINETIKLYARTGPQESTRVVSTTRHDIVDGKGVCVDEQHHRYRIPLLHHTHTHSHGHSQGRSAAQTPAAYPSTPGSPGTHSPNGYFPAHSMPGSPTHSHADLAPLAPTTTRSSSSSGGPSSSSASRVAATDSESVILPPLAQPSSQDESDPLSEPSSDVVTTLSITVPVHATPSHALEPIQVSHRIRWSILIGNMDGHTSELRCSLPLHVLDYRLYDEARSATLATRRLLLGAQDIDGGQAVGTNGEDNAEEDMELPSYPSHVRDRVANAYLPDSAVMRVVNPWVLQGVSPTIPPPLSETSSGVQSPAPLETWQVASGAPPPPSRHHLPHDPGPGAHPLEWVNTELLLSLSREAPEAPSQMPPPPPPPPPPTHAPAPAPHARATPPRVTPPDTSASSRHGSRFPSRRGSRANSRANSRASSPERGPTVVHGTAAGAVGPGGNGGETFVHSSSSASRNMHGLFHTAMKPFTSLGSTFSLSSRSPSHANLASHTSPSLSTVASASNINLLSQPGSGAVSPAPAIVEPPVPLTSPQLLHRAFTEVPDYDMASRGFLGGGITPLSSMRGLPSYEESERGSGSIDRSFSDTDLAGMFASANAPTRPRVVRTISAAPVRS